MSIPTPRRDDLPFTLSSERVALLVGFTAFLLPPVLWVIGTFTPACSFDSLSHYYYGRFSSDWFVGSLIFIGLLMLFLYRIPIGTPGYEGFRRSDVWMLRAAGLAGFLIAFFPTRGTGCEVMGADIARVFVEMRPEFVDLLGGRDAPTATLADLAAAVPGDAQARLSYSYFDLRGGLRWLDGALHNVGALVMFGALGYFSLFVFTRTQADRSLKGGEDARHAQVGLLKRFSQFTLRKKVRNLIYILSGIAIFGCIAGLVVQSVVLCGIEGLAGTCTWWNAGNMTLIVEWVALWAFGLSWLVKGRVISWLNDPPKPDGAMDQGAAA